MKALVNVQETLDRWGLTPIHRIVLGLDKGTLDEHLRLHYDLREKRDWQGRTPLHWAAIRGNEEIIRTLLKFKTDPSAPDVDQITPLHLAANYSSVNCVNLLLDAGANPNATSHYHSTPLHFAVRTRPMADNLRALVQKNGNLEIRDKYGQTVLFFALINTCVDIVPVLLELGADIEAEDEVGMTPVQVCVKLCLPGMIILLREHGAKMKHISGTGNTILHLAAKYADVETMQVLIHESLGGLNASEENSDGRTPETIFNERCLQESFGEGVRDKFKDLLGMCGGQPATGSDEQGYDTASEGQGEECAVLFHDALEEVTS
jgi:ankyrin repeat protein